MLSVPVPLCLEAIERLLQFPVPLRLRTYGKGRKWLVSVAFLFLLAASLVLAIMNPLRLPLRLPAPPSIRRGRQRRWMGACPVLCAREQMRSFHRLAVAASSSVVGDRCGEMVDSRV